MALAPAPLAQDDGALAPEPVPLVEEDVALAPEPAPLADGDVVPAEPVSPVQEPFLAEPASPIEELAPDDEDMAAFESPEAILPEEEVASAESVEPDLPLAAQAPLPDDLDPLLEEEPSDNVEEVPAAIASAEPIPSAEEQPAPDDLDPLLDEPSDSVEEAPAAIASAEPIPSAEEQPVLSAEEMSGAIDGAELASSDETAPFDMPVSWAFMELSRDQRAEVQARLQATGFYEGPADGAWDQATLAGLQAFLASEEGAGFDTSTLTGAGLALDFIRSDAYGEAHGLPALADEAVPDPNDPLASTDW